MKASRLQIKFDSGLPKGQECTLVLREERKFKKKIKMKSQREFSESDSITSYIKRNAKGNQLPPLFYLSSTHEMKEKLTWFKGNFHCEKHNLVPGYSRQSNYSSSSHLRGELLSPEFLLERNTANCISGNLSSGQLQR